MVNHRAAKKSGYSVLFWQGELRRAQRFETGIRACKMMQNHSAHNLIDTRFQIAHLLDGKLVYLELVQAVFSLPIDLHDKACLAKTDGSRRAVFADPAIAGDSYRGY